MCQLQVKHRIGVDDFDSYDFLTDFVGTVADTGCETFIVHARKAWLKGLSPKAESRDSGAGLWAGISAETGFP
jgi:tRNA-dihydrouridine synthase